MTPAAPVGDDAALCEELRDPTIVRRSFVREAAAARLESLRAENLAQAARIAELERENAALVSDLNDMIHDNVRLIDRDTQRLAELTAAQACIVAADAMRRYVAAAYVTISSDAKTVTMSNPAADAYDAARAGITLSDETK